MKSLCKEVPCKKLIFSACESDSFSSASSTSLDSNNSLQTSSSSSSSIDTHLEIKQKLLFGPCSSMNAEDSTGVESPEVPSVVAAGTELEGSFMNEPPAAAAKQYRNSPFGLTRHYLTMPDSNERPQDLYKNHIVNKYTTDEDVGEEEEDSELELDVGRLKQSVSTAKLPLYSNRLKEDELLQGDSKHQILCNPQGFHHPTTAISGASNNHQDWSCQSSQPKRLEPIGLVGYDHHHHHDVPQRFDSPAGDAGLDPSECNAKDFQHYRRDSTSQHPVHLPDNLRKLKMNELVEPREESGSLLVRFSSIMYATFLVILGCILHVSELRQKSKNSSDHIYTTIVALLGIIWLLFLQMDLQRYKRYASKYILIETIFNDQRQKSIDEELRRKELDPTARSTSSSSASLVNDRMSMNTEVIFKKTAYKMYQQRISMNRHNKMNLSKTRLGTNSHHLNEHQSSLEDTSSDQYAADDDLVPAYKFLHGKMGANFYLKCGMAAFCFGHVIHEGLRFGQQVYFFGTDNTHCKDSAALVAHLVTPLYSFYQLFMMFKYSNLVINRHKVLAQFGLMHIIGTSVTFWFRTILEEAFEDFVHKMDYFKTNRPQLNLNFGGINPSESSLISMLTSITNTIRPPQIINERIDSGWSVTSSLNNTNNLSFTTQSTSPATTTTTSPTTMAQSLLTLMSSPISATITPQLVRHLPESYACAQNTLLTTKSMNALPYLYPFTIEYNLLLAATFLSLYFNIGKIGHLTGVGGCRPSILNYTHMHQKHQNLNSGLGSNVESSDNSSAIKMRDSLEKDYIGEYKSNFVVNADCHSANKGLFCGFFVLLVTLVTIVIFFVTINKPTHIQLGIKINLIQEATLTALILIVTLAGYKQIVKLNRNRYLRDKVTTDDVLMLIPLPFFFIHSLLSFRAETALMSSNGIASFSSSLLQGNNNVQQQDSLAKTKNEHLGSLLLNTNNNSSHSSDSRSRLNNSLINDHLNGTNGRFAENLISNINNSNRSGRNMANNNFINNDVTGVDGSNINNNSSQLDHFKLITVALNIIVMIEVLVQTNFIIDGMRRCSESRYLRFKKPGRELITFAILLNITYWIVATFETKSVEQYKTEIEYYGPLPYMFISHTTLPVMLFYRYHSSVCLAEIWNRAYKPPKKR